MKKISIVAHRGGAALFPENTLKAFKHAIELGADEVECDVHMMNDGNIVVFHDFEMTQLTGQSQKIEDIDNKTRQNLIVGGGNECPPLLEELAELLTKSKTKLHIEIKVNGHLSRELQVAEKSLAILKNHHLIDRISAISFEPQSLKPFIKAGIPSGPCIENPAELLKTDLKQKINDWKNAGYKDLSLNSTRSPLEFVHQVIDAGFTVGVWTVNGPARLAHWINQPVDYITTDQPDLALKMRDQKK